MIVGRRGGKSRVAALIAVFLACFRTYKLAPGERGVVMVIAADKKQARTIKRYVSGLLASVPMLAALIESESAESLELKNGISIEITAASFRAVRGYTVVAAIADEVAFWRNEDSSNPDAEILNALRPAMATVPGALLLCISSPYWFRGELARAFRDHYGKDDDEVLVVKAPTKALNPSIPDSVIERARREDPAAAAAEWDAEFRRDVDGFLDRSAIEACVTTGRYEIPPVAGVTYRAFVDPAGGSGGDSFTCAVAHGNILDAIREIKPPFSPERAVEELAAFLRSYRVSSVKGDRYAGEWPREQFQKRGILYDPSARSKSECYLELLPLVNSGRVELLDVPRLIGQAAQLERRTGRSGRDSVDHPPGGHDDVINAVAGVLTLETPGMQYRVRSLMGTGQESQDLAEQFARAHRMRGGYVNLKGY